MKSGRYLSPICRSPKPPAGRGSIPCARFWTPSSTWCAAVAPGASYPTTSHPGRLSTTTSASGGSMVRGSGCTKHFAAGHGYASEGTRSPAPPSSIPRASRPPEWAVRGAATILELVGERFPHLSQLWLDAGYNGKGKGKDWAEKALGLSAEVVRPPRRWVWVPADQQPPPRPAFTVLPRRWVVERTFSWVGQNRRMSKDYERLPESSEAFIYVAMTRLMARRLAH